MTRHKPRSGFTAIELLVVLGIAMLLMAMAVPGLVGALRKSTVSDAASSITRASSQARQLARSRLLSSTAAPLNFYGVVLVNDESPSYVALTWGTTASKANILLRTSDANPVCKLTFNRNVTVMLDGNLLDSPGVLGWMYQYRTGKPIITNSLTAPNYNIGAKNLDGAGATIPGTETISKTLSVQTIDGRYKAAVAIYQIGLANIQEY